MTHGFRLIGLTLTGPDRPDAAIGFESGLNVIAGPSDTGKTYIVQCIDFAMGAGRTPKDIPEAAGYDRVRLDLETGSGDLRYALERSLTGAGPVMLSSPTEPPRPLRAKHDPTRDDTVSRFLLGLSGFAGERILQAKAGPTRPVSFRDVARFVIVDEQAMMAERSPVLSGQYTASTPERRTFRLLLTGQGDGEVAAAEDARRRRVGREEILQELAVRARLELEQLDAPADARQAEQSLAVFVATANTARATLAASQQAAAAAERRRRNAWRDLRAVQTQAQVLRELQSRFVVLEQQYETDLGRLAAITEAAARLGDLGEQPCPVCGAPAEHQEHSQQAAPVAEEVAEASRAEERRTRTLLTDLQDTREANAADIERLAATVEQRTATLAALDAELDETVKPQLAEAAEAFAEAEAGRRHAERVIESMRRLAELERLLTDARKAAPTSTLAPASVNVTSGEVEAFSREVEALLHDWRFPDLGRVTWSEQSQDVVISGRPRTSHGKGVLAITHAAFSLALLRHCLDADRAHPSFAVLDSPLVVYRQPDPGEEAFPTDVKEHFYRAAAQRFSDAQVIVLENDPPPSDLDATVITFTHADHGRYGFLPRR